MNEEDRIKRRMMEKLKAQNTMSNEENNLRKEIKNILIKILDKKAYERLGNIRFVKPKFAQQLELYLIQLYQSGQINSIITDEQFKKILSLLTKKTEFKIRRL